jgi:flagellin
MLSLRTNVASLNAQNNLSQTQSQLATSMARLSSGFRITKSGDDAAGLAISSSLDAQIASFTQAGLNANDGLSLVQTGEAALNNVSSILSRLRQLAMQSASDGVSNADRTAYIQTEATALVSEIDRMAAATTYNGTALINGTVSTLDFQVGVDGTVNSRISVSTGDATATTLLGAGFAATLATKAGAQGALAAVDTAIQTVSSLRAQFGAAGNRFQAAVANIQSFSEALSAANSRIRDVDVAAETSALARSQILSQAGISVLAQANQMPQLALKLLQ